MGYGAKLTSKGQTTIPIEIRKYLNLSPGDQMDFIIENGEVKLRAKTRSVMEFAGILGHAPNGVHLTVEEMSDAAAQAAADDDRRIMRDWHRYERTPPVSDDGRPETVRKRS
ncbi:AbrB/MazE/SpoVT family DNA-binding domain-containing protein [Neorhizobium sp. BETTINA12A]|uniref:AbrB/MazE/SpoVT family DNA-binding domain-containing protein n=1 Tax=unclassified Neorhizobium TaxID=2629175 RepID=UPI001FF4A437|nr:MULTISPECIES: AbrB/MazE/SpoVT family DNA-binding domain-containing protein [unclassified Neorhizobium]MCJ9673408.1 AbrB/MazE/SpoVT family DNA-binding domain-containing protein [Neorhizobium sp. SHOUNA12B]MCJ9743839.1 AbrB/MazE/SpoVT family DNA-binding domain-containing protein [Neorhizobium sp. SHOUNA12A]MCJ9753816.1 AbrB/MazE/SpoVT family DNA-binding domain-containing protein [Neorhizobium sp. BETTINA12A]